LRLKTTDYRLEGRGGMRIRIKMKMKRGD